MAIQLKPYGIIIGVLALVLLLYSNTLQGEFHLDDFPKIKNNLNNHLDMISLKTLTKVLLQIRPVAHFTFALNYYVHHLDVFGYHLVNLLIHLATTVALFYFVRLTLTLPSCRSQWGHYADAVAIMTSLLWAIHPVQTQAVNYLVQRMTLLSALFYLLTLIAYIMARKSTGRTPLFWYSLAVVSLALAFGSKETAVTLPIFILLYEWYFLSGSFGTAVRRVSLLGLLCVVLLSTYVILYFGNQQTGGIDIIRTLFLEDYIPFKEMSIPFFERALTEARVVVYYVSLLILPHPSRLNLDYDFPVSHSWTDPWTTLPSVLFLLGTVGYAGIIAKKRPLISFCIFWFYGNLMIESFVFQLDLVFEHRLYLPSMGFLLLVSMGTVLLAERLSLSVITIQKVTLAIVMTSAVLLWCLWTYERNGVWQTEIRLWEDVVKKSPKNARGYLNLGKAYQIAGNLDKADEVYRSGLEINPPKHYYSRILMNQALIHLTKRNYSLAANLLEQAVQVDPNAYLSLFNLGVAYKAMSQYDLALSALEKSRDLYAQHEWTHLLIGEIFENRRDFVKAIEAYQRGITAMADHSWRIRNKLARVYEQIGRLGDAENEYQISLGLNPQQPEIHYYLGNIYYTQKRLNAALSAFDKALQLDPGYLDARNNLGSTYAAMGDLQKAVREFSRVLDAKPDHPAASQNLYQARQILKSTQQQF